MSIFAYPPWAPLHFFPTHGEYYRAAGKYADQSGIRLCPTCNGKAMAKRQHPMEQFLHQCVRACKPRKMARAYALLTWSKWALKWCEAPLSWAPNEEIILLIEMLGCGNAEAHICDGSIDNYGITFKLKSTDPPRLRVEPAPFF